MLRYLETKSRRSTGIIVLLMLGIWGIVSHGWAYAESSPVTAAVGALDTGNQEKSWLSDDIEGQVDRPLLIHLDLAPYPPPAGAFYTAVVDVLESPAGAEPEILPGVPEISVRCPKPGIYRLRIRANLIEKSSCALADFRILNEQEIRLIISP